ncbi:tetratricopeptide repeat protein [Paenarthrobacter sp. Z7-10]|uniref:co-chaperone YbbN n=1 Tax=Paenarthrobacter sp. Z7-10 TaxID=2787635 RepID=UPI0022A90982|nr:tetratricopeptide repeat protein [Paenarthrobacter sp. Z7-10]MCZ2404114.1 tetratricopeptide repeat protein [Paenarthrobacter sp. Z7-10]
MTSPGSLPVNPAATAGINLRGAVDLSALKNPRPAAPTGSAAPAGGSGAAEGSDQGGFAVDVTEQSFPEVVQLSAQVPVIVSLGAAWSGQSSALNTALERVVAGYAGRLLLARVDAEANPQIAQAFNAQAIPTVVAMIKGQPVPLFEGDLPEDQIRRFMEELLKVAASNGVDGTLGSAENDDAEPVEVPLPPLHQAAYDAIEAGDYAGAEAAYRQALAEQPADAEAKAGLAQVQLMQRTASLSAAEADDVRRRAADEPDLLEFQLAAADLDVVGGHVEDAFARLTAFIAGHFGPERETARVRLLELFDVVGSSDPRVAKARQALARALF